MTNVNNLDGDKSELTFVPFYFALNQETRSTYTKDLNRAVYVLRIIFIKTSNYCRTKFTY